MILSEFIEDIYRFGLEKFRRYYGFYAAIVISNQDPEGKGRIQVSCPRAKLASDNGIWVWPMFMGAGITNRNGVELDSQGAPVPQVKCGEFWPPTPGSGVWITFDNGDPTKPLNYCGSWYAGVQQSELNPDMAPDVTNTPQKRGWISNSGSEVIFDDTPQGEQIIIKMANGQQIIINNTQILLGNATGQFEPMLKGSTVKQYLDNHIHQTPFGPTSPPSEPLPDSALSQVGEVS
jgi:hypothetical protein